ncbi:MAG: YcbK family protein [Pikeienuella sp.]
MEPLTKNNERENRVGDNVSIIKNNLEAPSRRGALGLIVGAATSIIAAPSFASTPALLTGAGDIRRVHLHNKNTGDSLDAVYWVDGEYIPEVKSEIDFLMRDWRQNIAIDYDYKAVDFLAALHRKLNTSEPMVVVSGYRSKKTNAMLRRNYRGVAKDSYHTKGMAVDIKISGRLPSKIARAARGMGIGGVGQYRTFTHIDSGPVRSWRR